MDYRFEATSIAGFVQQAVTYYRHGYHFYAPGTLTERCDVHAVDRAIISRYGLDLSKYQRYRRYQKGEAKVQYLRHGLVFAIFATKGRHEVFSGEALDDVRTRPLRFAGYSIAVRNGRVSVRIEEKQFRVLLEVFKENAGSISPGVFAALPFEAYEPIRRQFFRLLSAVNDERSARGLPLIPWSALRLRRRPVKVFE